MVRSEKPQYDKYKHSLAATKKGGFGKGGKGTWGDARDDMKGMEGSSAQDVLKEDMPEVENNAPEKREISKTEFELNIWNITRGKKKQVVAMLESFPGFVGVVPHFGRRRVEMNAYFDTLENANKALILNNTKLGSRYLGVRYTKALSDLVAEKDKAAGAGANE